MLRKISNFLSHSLISGKQSSGSSKRIFFQSVELVNRKQHLSTAVAMSDKDTKVGKKKKIMEVTKFLTIRKARYDGRVKKRQWEERRSDGEVGEKKRREGEGSEDAFERVKRRKFAVLMGYSGVNYYGMQRNPSMVTIEEDLFTALLKAGFIDELAFKQVQQLHFQRAARTDKGVSAVRQVVSMKLPETIDAVEINKHLPETIRIFGIRRVTKGFNSKSQCDGRTYIYVLPTVVFSNFKDPSEQETFRLSDEDLYRINELLAKFVGTKNFHNYTSRKKHHDPSASRYIMSFTCEDPFIENGVEFTVLRVKGQSFMMHQIRKMVGITLAIIRGHTNEETFERSFTKEKVNVPKVPGLGLVLDFVHYDRYNNRYSSDHDTLDWVKEETEVETFKRKYIYPTIIETEVKEKPMLDYVSYMWKHRYDVFDEQNEVDSDAGEVNEDVKSEEINGSSSGQRESSQIN